MAPKNQKPSTRVAENRKARHEYFIDEEIEAGLALTGTEVKSLRQGKASLNDAYAGEMGGEMWLFNAHIAEYAGGNRFNHEPKRPRKLLLHKKQINKLLGLIKQKGVTLVPLAIFFNQKGFAKVNLGLARGKKQYEKRETEKARDWQREKASMMKNR